MDVYTIQMMMMMMSKVSPHCDVQKVKKSGFCARILSIEGLKGGSRSGGFPFRFLSFREGGTQQSIDHPPSCLCPVACALFGGHDYENDHGVSLSVYSLPPRRRFLFFFRETTNHCA